MSAKATLKFDQVRSSGRGLSITLRKEDGEPVGLISSCFVSSNRGAFCSNLSPGYLTASASVFDLKSGKTVRVAEWANSSCRRRAEADSTFRQWLRDENIRGQVMQAALDFELDE